MVALLQGMEKHVLDARRLVASSLVMSEGETLPCWKIQKNIDRNKVKNSASFFLRGEIFRDFFNYHFYFSNLLSPITIEYVKDIFYLK